MNNLKSFVILQARLYEFLEQQDEETLQAIVSGTAQLAVLSNGDAQAPVSPVTRERGPIASRPAPTDITMAPSDDPYQAAQDLPKLTSEHERRVYLNATGLNVRQLHRVARLLGLKRYSKLSKAKLIALLAGRGPHETDAVAVEPISPKHLSPEMADENSTDERQATTEEARPSPMAQPTDTTKLKPDVAAIASRLRDIETEEEGAAYLRTQRLDREGLLAVAAELQLTRVDRLKPSELEKRVLKQAIGARRKFAGLRKW